MKPDIPQEVRIVNAIAEQLFDVWPVSIVMIDLEDRIWRVNKQMSDELQLDTDIIGKSVFDLLEVVQDKQNVLPRYLQELREGCQRIIPLSSNCFIYEQKRHISFLIQGALIGVYEEERLVRIVLYYRNVLEERTQKRLLNIALSRTQIFQWSYDLERNLMIIDPRYFEYLGIPTRDYTLTPEEFAYLIHPDDRQSVFDALTLQLDGNLYEAPVEYRLRRDDGSWEWFEAQSTYVGQLKEAPYRIVGICMSTQKYKDTEDCLNEALRKARHSDELKSIFLANMSHEVRTPLNAIVGFSSLLAHGDSDLTKDDIIEFTSLIEKNSQLLMVLISDILDLSKIESNTMEFNFCNISLHQVLNEIGSAQRMNMKKGVELLLDLPGQEITISTDPTRLSQVINNLVNNAIKFTSEGNICIGYRPATSNRVKIFVEDTGTGMAKEVIEHIFDRFYKGDAFKQGTGLGLSISKIIVEKLGGKIAVQSKMETGTTFTFTLPYISANGDMKWEEKLTPASIKDNNRTSHQEMTILVAEDYQSNYDLIEAMLGKMYKLVHAYDGMEAIIFYEQYKPDLILMDIKMPNINGLDATKAIREMSASVPVIAVSAYAYEKDKTAAIESGCNEFLTKPVSADLLKMTINKYLKQK